jgi:hypothetical protein
MRAGIVVSGSLLLTLGAAASGSASGATQSQAAAPSETHVNEHALGDHSAGSSTWAALAAGTRGAGYWAASASGAVDSFGYATFAGSASALDLNQPIVGMASTAGGRGYWLVATDGGIFSFGDATFFGSTGALRLNKPIVGMAATSDDRGYWLVASDGGVFAFGDAAFYGSMGGQRLNAPVAGIVPTPNGGGYWLVATDGGVFSFGDAVFSGSLGAHRPSSPITSLAPAPGGGYWALGADGTVYPFGAAPDDASLSGWGAPADALAADPNGGYWILTQDGRVHPESGAPDYGDPVRGALTAPGSGLGATGSSGGGLKGSPPPSIGGMDVITSADGHLQLGGTSATFTGVNAYELATDWGTNIGCGEEISPSAMTSLFDSLGPGSLVRFQAYQGTTAVNPSTGAIDWGPLDAVFAAAAAAHVYLVPVISAQGGTCDGGRWQDPAWYDGGYMNTYPNPPLSAGEGEDVESYWNYMTQIVQRYKDAPALGMWEPMGEAEASTCPAQDEPYDCNGNQTCPDETVAARALRSFYDTVGAEIHSLDPNHLVEAGFLGGGQCGTAGTDYAYVGASPGIDVLSVHDYYGYPLMGGDQWNGMAVRFAQAAELDKPIITGESGVEGGIGQTGCESLTQRAGEFEAKMATQIGDGDSAFLVWNWSLDSLGPCSYNTGPGDPLMSVLHAYATAT